MTLKSTLFAALAIAGATAAAAPDVGRIAERLKFDKKLHVTAERIAADRNTGSLVASGRVDAVCRPARLMTDYLERDAEGLCTLAYPSSFTTCTNESCSLHWRVTGEISYKEGEFARVRNGWLRFCEIPILWMPYFYYPLDLHTGWRVMPGYTKRWGAYLMTKYVYNIYDGGRPGGEALRLSGATRFDLRSENGIALGQTLNWHLGDFGRGKFKVYYAWDLDADRYEHGWENAHKWNYRNWASDVPDNRYALQLEHRWDVTERDSVRVSGVLYSDSHMRRDFFKHTLLGVQNDFLEDNGNELAWEHNEKRFGLGMSVSGPLEDFRGGVSRLPEFHFDVMPQSVFGLAANYESETLIGYLRRNYAKYGDDKTDLAYRYMPGLWAHYGTFRLDSYHRLSAPFKLADVVSVVPRLAVRGTYWNESGNTVIDGNGSAGKTGDDVFRTIFEFGTTFAARGTADLDDEWQHIVEPYADVLAQEAWYSGLSGDRRHYVFDSVDASRDWSDQFAGRSRNLPYSWYGVTPGFRNVLRKRDDKGFLRTLGDIDAYVALQFNDADWTEGDRYHRLAKKGEPNYGKNAISAYPGVRARYFPNEDTTISARLEYDSDNSRIATAGVAWHQRFSDKFRTWVDFSHRDHRWWDYSSTPYDEETMNDEDFNWARFSRVTVGCEHEICDSVAWSPFVAWDCREGELEEVGGWIDYRLDCLGFRLSVTYENDYERVDGSRYDDDVSVGFFVYLRCFGPSSGNPFAD